MKMSFRTGVIGAALLASAAMLPAQSQAQGFLISTNGLVAIGVNPGGNLDIDGIMGSPRTSNAGPLGIAYNFGASGPGGRTGWQDALSPGCLCEALGVAGNGAGSSIGRVVGNNGITLVSETFVPGTSYTTVITGAAGLTVTQVVTLGPATATGALFKANVTISNTTGATVTGVQYGRAMDWDVPPTEFNEFVEHAGVAFTGNLLRATDDGFADPNPISAITNGGLVAVPNTNGDQNGASDHGSLFVFGFGDLLDGTSVSFDIYYGAGGNRADALALIGAAGAELYSFGLNSGGGAREPTFIFAFDGVGLPPVGVPAPAALGLFGLGLLGLGLVKGRRRV